MHAQPNLIDGARVLLYADTSRFSKTDAVRHLRDGRQQFSFAPIAICRYDGSDDCYLFLCDENWQTANDNLYDSIDEAIESALQQFAGLERHHLIEANSGN